MPLGHDHLVVPRVARERHDIGIAIERFGRDTNVGFAIDDHLRDLLRIALTQGQVHLREHLLELLDHTGQRIARLRVRGGHHEVTRVMFRELACDATQVFGVEQHALDGLVHGFARLGETRQALAATNEDIDPELVLEILDLFRHARLRCIEDVRDFGQIHVLTHRLANKAQLLEVHGALLSF